MITFLISDPLYNLIIVFRYEVRKHMKNFPICHCVLKYLFGNYRSTSILSNSAKILELFNTKRLLFKGTCQINSIYTYLGRVFDKLQQFSRRLLIYLKVSLNYSNFILLAVT